jgi:hypothetical protein
MPLVVMVTGECEAIGMRAVGGDLRDEIDGGEGAGGGTRAVPARRFSATGEVDEVAGR